MKLENNALNLLTELADEILNMEYKILYDKNADKLASEVSKAISEGWKPVGGVAVAQSDYYSQDSWGYREENFQILFAQAMRTEA